jgi:hypothetical protein
LDFERKYKTFSSYSHESITTPTNERKIRDTRYESGEKSEDESKNSFITVYCVSQVSLSRHLTLAIVKMQNQGSFNLASEF